MIETAKAQVAQANTSAARNTGTGNSDPHAAATEIMQRNTNQTGLDISGVRRDLAALAAQDAEFAAQVHTAVEARLTPVQLGQLASASFTVGAPDGGGIAFSDDGMTVAERFASPAGSADRTQYDRFDRIWGDGNPATNDSAAIERGLSDMIASGLSLEQVEAAAGTPVAANENTTDTATLIADLTQMGIDIVGIVDPTGAADGANAIISLGRAGLALWNGNGGEALGHLGNGALSAISILPLGDLAKAGKIGKWADTISSAIRAAADNPVVCEAVTPLLREIATNLDRIPQSAIDALPAGARESIERMKTQLDEFLGVGARGADDAASPSYTGTVRGQRVVLEGVDTVSVNYVKRDRAAYNTLRREFDSGVRADFLKSLTTDPDNLVVLRRAGFDDAAIERIASGRVPQGCQVHHKLPLDDGGTNSFDNLVLIRNDPHHIALTNAQRQLVGDLEVGQARQVEFPIPPGVVYPPR